MGSLESGAMGLGRVACNGLLCVRDAELKKDAHPEFGRIGLVRGCGKLNKGGSIAGIRSLPGFGSGKADIKTAFKQYPLLEKEHG